MVGYIGTSKRDIEYLIESVQEPGVSVRRERRAKCLCAFMDGPNTVYRFSKGGKKLFAICVIQKAGLENIEMSIMCNRVFSDPVREGDEGYRKACVLFQLAEKMYEVQRGISVKSAQQSTQSQQAKVFCEIFSRIR